MSNNTRDSLLCLVLPLCLAASNWNGRHQQQQNAAVQSAPVLFSTILMADSSSVTKAKAFWIMGVDQWVHAPKGHAGPIRWRHKLNGRSQRVWCVCVCVAFWLCLFYLIPILLDPPHFDFKDRTFLVSWIKEHIGCSQTIFNVYLSILFNVSYMQIPHLALSKWIEDEKKGTVWKQKDKIKQKSSSFSSAIVQW